MSSSTRHLHVSVLLVLVHLVFSQSSNGSISTWTASTLPPLNTSTPSTNTTLVPAPKVSSKIDGGAVGIGIFAACCGLVILWTAYKCCFPGKPDDAAGATEIPRVAYGEPHIYDCTHEYRHDNLLGGRDDYDPSVQSVPVSVARASTPRARAASPIRRATSPMRRATTPMANAPAPPRRATTPAESTHARYEALGTESMDTILLVSRRVSPCPEYTPLPFQSDQHSDVSEESDSPEGFLMRCYHMYRPSVPELDQTHDGTRVPRREELVSPISPATVTPSQSQTYIGRPLGASLSSELTSPISPAAAEAGPQRTKSYERVRQSDWQTQEHVTRAVSELDQRHTKIHELDRIRPSVSDLDYGQIHFAAPSRAYTSVTELDHESTQIHELDHPVRSLSFPTDVTGPGSAQHRPWVNELHLPRPAPHPQASHYPGPVQKKVSFPVPTDRLALLSASIFPPCLPKPDHLRTKVPTAQHSASVPAPARPPKITVVPSRDSLTMHDPPMPGAPETGVSIFSGSGDR